MQRLTAAALIRRASIRRALRAADRWTVRIFNPLPKPLGLGPHRHG
jgi:hypothetical protein